MVKRWIGIILARGGSKRLPRKNVLDFGGKPMLAWSVEAALHSDCFDRVLVSTDDKDIAEVGRRYGAEVPFLRDGGSDDHSSSSEASLIALRQAEEYWNEEYQHVAQMMANCPLRSAGDIRTAVSAFEASDAGSQISAFRFGWMNPWWAMRLDADGQPYYLFPDARKSRSQDLPPLYCPSGALWLARRDILNSARTFYAPGHVIHPMHWMSAMDIDDWNDLSMAKACLHLKRSSPDQSSAG